MAYRRFESRELRVIERLRERLNSLGLGFTTGFSEAIYYIEVQDIDTKYAELLGRTFGVVVKSKMTEVA